MSIMTLISRSEEFESGMPGPGIAAHQIMNQLAEITLASLASPKPAETPSQAIISDSEPAIDSKPSPYSITRQSYRPILGNEKLVDALVQLQKLRQKSQTDTGPKIIYPPRKPAP